MSEQHHSPKNFSFTGFVKLIRIQNLIIIILSQYLAALYLLEGIHLSNIRLFLLSLSTVIIAAAGYIINDYYDVKIDYVNKPQRVVVGKVLKRRVVLFWHTFMNFTAIAIAFYLSWKLAAVFFGSAFLLWLYSNQLKRLPFVGNFTVALLTGLSLTIIGLYFHQKEVLINIYALFAFAISLIREIIKDMEDWKGDADFGCKTLPIVFGIRKTKLIIYVLIALFGFLIFYLTQFLNNDILYYYFSGLALFIIYFVYRLQQADKIKDFHFLSNFCKLIMLSGIISMLLF
jgi:4-hydroxybenzoate polyprenyltransferase